MATTTQPNTPEADCCAQPFDPTARRDYIRFQFCLWGFFLLLSFIHFTWDGTPTEYRSYIAGIKVYETIMMATCSHIIWLVARKRRWFSRSKPLRVRVSVICLFSSTAVLAVSAPLIWKLNSIARSEGAVEHNLFFILFLNWIGIAVGLTIWGGLYSAYYYQARTRYLETERARLLAAGREAQLMALKGQLNPHFLFNSLNTLRALIQREPKAARDAVTHLADMMRHSLTLSDFAIIPLAAELSFVNDYLALEHLRHEDRLRIKQRIAPEALRENIPPMLLLTLVENAVKHGLNQRSGGIDVICEIWLEPHAGAGTGGEKTIHLRVTNQGFLVLADKPADEDAPLTTGTGLRNIRERLRLLYGERASLSVSQEEHLVVAKVALPAVPAPANGVDFLITGETPAFNPDTQP